MHRHIPMVGAISLAALMSAAGGASAQLALSANDGKAVLVDGVNTVPASPAADSVTIIDLNSTPPKVVGEIAVPTSVVGPPSSVAIARDETFALVTAASCCCINFSARRRVAALSSALLRSMIPLASCWV